MHQMFAQCNAGRRARFAEELPLLRALPARRLEACKRDKVRVDSSSTLRVEGNSYSVGSRLIGEWVEARLYAERVEVWYAQKQVEQLPRLRGRGKHKSAYRHVIDLAERECQERRNHRVQRLLHQSRLPLEKSWQTLDLKRLPPKVVQQARSLLEGSFVDRHENVLVFGQAGSGKTPLLCALGQELVRSGRRVQFAKSGLLVQELLAAKRDLKLSRGLNSTFAKNPGLQAQLMKGEPPILGLTKEPLDKEAPHVGNGTVDGCSGTGVRVYFHGTERGDVSASVARLDHVPGVADRVSRLPNHPGG